MKKAMCQYANLISTKVMREVADDELARCRQVKENHKKYVSGEVDRKRDEFTRKLAEQFELLKNNERVRLDDDASEWYERLIELAEQVRNAKTIAQIEACWPIDEIASNIDWATKSAEERQQLHDETFLKGNF